MYLLERNINYTFLTSSQQQVQTLRVTLSAGGTYTLYADDAAVNNIGTITIDPGGITETDDTTVDAKYTVVTGSITFVGAYGNKDIRVFGPNPGSKWTVTSSNLLTTGASQVFAV